MQAGKRYTLKQTLLWGKKYILLFLLYDTIPVSLYYFLDWDWLAIPWQPLSLIGIAVAFYLGFKNNSSYERMWEARKIWGGIVNVSRSFTVMVREFIDDDRLQQEVGEEELNAIRKTVVHRHVAWLHALALQLRKVQPWEHDSQDEMGFRDTFDLHYSEKKFEKLKEYISDDDYAYVMGKGNKASHLISLQSKHLAKLRQDDLIDHFRHLELQGMITEFYTLQGQSERIKNFPFPRQYATVN